MRRVTSPEGAPKNRQLKNHHSSNNHVAGRLVVGCIIGPDSADKRHESRSCAPGGGVVRVTMVPRPPAPDNQFVQGGGRGGCEWPGPSYIFQHLALERKSLDTPALGKTNLLLTLHDTHISIIVHILSDDQLYMPLLLGLDFMCASQIVLMPHLRKYVMPGGREHSFLTKTRDALQWGFQDPIVNFFMAVWENASIEQPSLPLLEAQPEVVRPLLQKWCTVWTESTGATEIVKHKMQVPLSSG